MKNLKFLLIFLAFISLAGSCERRESDVIAMKVPGDAIIKGRITTANGAKPAPNLTVTIFWIYDNIIRQKANVKTDANGYYSVNLLVRPEEAKNGEFSLCLTDAHLQGYFYYNGEKPEEMSFLDTSIQRNDVIIANYNVPQPATIKFTLENSVVYTPDYYYQFFSPDNGKYVSTQFFFMNTDFPTTYQLERTVPADTPITLQANTTIRMGGVLRSSKTYNIPAIAPNQTLVQPISF